MGLYDYISMLACIPVYSIYLYTLSDVSQISNPLILKVCHFADIAMCNNSDRVATKYKYIIST